MQGTFASLGQELRELGSPGPRVRTVAMATLAVVLSVAAALALHLDNVWWAGISAFMSTQATRPELDPPGLPAHGRHSHGSCSRLRHDPLARL